MSTRRIYYDDPSARAVDAVVVGMEQAADGESRVLLDRTPFYPEGGGQPCDTGTIAGLDVKSALETGDDVVHSLEGSLAELEAAGVAVGATVRCLVDLERRNGHSEQHSAQHLLSAVIMRALGGTTLSFHLGERWSSIDIDLPPMERACADQMEDEVNRVIRDDYRVITHLCPPGDAGDFPLRKEPRLEAAVLRVVEIDGIEYSACCGTHVTSTGVLGAFRVGRVEKYKGGSRVHFIAGSRAFADWRRLAALARDAAAAAGVSEDELAATVAASRERVRTLEKALDEANGRVAGLEAASLAAAPIDRTGYGVVLASAEGVDAAARLARALAALGRVAVVSSLADLRVVASSPAQPPKEAEPGMARAAVDVGSVFGPLARTSGGSGGGGKTFFQAAFPDRAALVAFLDAAHLA